MRIGFLTAPFADKPLAETLHLLNETFPGLDCVEVGAGLWGIAHCDPGALLAHDSSREEFEETIVSAGLRLSALSAHGNPLHPDPEASGLSLRRLRESIALIVKLDRCLAHDAAGNPIRVVNGFSGLPSADVSFGSGRAGDVAVQGGRVPGWTICPWPDEHFDAYGRQMKFAGRIWKELVREARDSGVALALEWHPNFIVHNTETYLELLELCDDDGTTLGVNLDPCHFFWRNMDPIAVVRHLSRTLGRCPVKHCHGKDTYVDPYNTAINGCCTSTAYSRETDRAWRFVTMGEGWDPVIGPHDLNWWSRFVTELQLWGYDHVISIEHEDSRKSYNEGLGKALNLLQSAVNREPPGPMSWTDR